jgi:hypothetical protein
VSARDHGWPIWQRSEHLSPRSLLSPSRTGFQMRRLCMPPAAPSAALIYTNVAWKPAPSRDRSSAAASSAESASWPPSIGAATVDRRRDDPASARQQLLTHEYDAYQDELVCACNLRLIEHQICFNTVCIIWAYKY